MSDAFKQAGAEKPDLGLLLRATSRTFALSIEMLPRPLRKQLTVGYLVLRVSDYLEDNSAMSAAAKTSALDLWAAVLEARADADELEELLDDSPSDSIPDFHAARAAGRIAASLGRLPPRARELIVRHTVATTRGMARWVERGPDFADLDDLDDYMHEVAGRVGHLVTSLAALRWQGVCRDLEERMRLAREFGLGLQTVNVLRGLSSDRDRGWIFVPRSMLPPGMAPSSIFDEAHRETAVSAVLELADKAEAHLEGALAWVTSLPLSATRLKIAFVMPLLFGARTLALCRERPGEVVDGTVKMTRSEVTALVRKTLALGWSNAWVRGKTRGLLRPRPS